MLRARQTAGEIAQATGAELRVETAALTGATAEDLGAAVEDARVAVATVGHQPDCSEIALALTGSDPGFPPAGMAAIELAVTWRFGHVGAISVRDLRKSYDGVEAVRGISFEVAAGEVFGLLGPNGAGKTTTVEILEGYRQRDGGDGRRARLRPGARRASVPGADRRRPAAVGALAEPDGARGAPARSPATTRSRATSTR